MNIYLIIAHLCCHFHLHLLLYHVYYYRIYYFLLLVMIDCSIVLCGMLCIGVAMVVFGSFTGAKGTTGTTPTTAGMVGIASPPRSSVPHMMASGHFFQSPMPVPNSAAPMPYPYPPYPMPPYTMMTTTANHPAIPSQVRGIPARTLSMEGNPGTTQHQAQAAAAAMSLNTMSMPLMIPPPGAFAPGMHPYMYSGPFGAAVAAGNVPSMVLSANVPSNPFAQQPSSSSSRRVSKKVDNSGLSGTKTPASNAAVGKTKHDEGEEKVQFNTPNAIFSFCLEFVIGVMFCLLFFLIK